MDVRTLYLQTLDNGRIELELTRSQRLEEALRHCHCSLRLLEPTHSCSPGMLTQFRFPRPVSCIGLPPRMSPPAMRFWLAIGLGDGTIHICDLRTGVPVLGGAADRPLVWKGHDSFPWSDWNSAGRLAWSSRGRLASVGTDDHSVVVWSPGMQDEPIWRSQALESPARCVAWAPDEALAAGFDDGTIAIWDLAAGVEPVWTVPGHSRCVTSAAWNLDGYLASGSQDTSLAVWDRGPDREQLWRQYGNEGWINCLGWHPDGRLASGGGSLRIWDAQDSHQIVWEAQSDTSGLISTAWGPHGLLAAACADRMLRVFYPKDGRQPFWRTQGHEEPPVSMVWHSDGYLVSASRDGMVAVWEAPEEAPAPGEMEAALSQFDHGIVAAVHSSYQGSAIPIGLGVSNRPSPYVSLYPCVGDFFGWHSTVEAGWCATWHPDGRIAMGRAPDVNSSYGRLGVYRSTSIGDAEWAVNRTDTGHRIDLSRSYGGPLWSVSVKGGVYSVDWHPDGRLATGSRWEGIATWDPRDLAGSISRGTEKPTWRALEDQGGVLFVAWHVDGRLACVGSAGPVAVWDPQRSEKPLWIGLHLGVGKGGHSLFGRARGQSLAWHVDGLLATGITPGRGFAEDTVAVWDPGGPDEPIWCGRVHQDTITALAWNSQGCLASGSDDCSVAVWELGQERPLWRSVCTASRLLSLVWSPDGRWLAATSTDQRVMVLSGADGTMVARYGANASVLALQWAPDSREIWAADNGASFGYPCVYKLALGRRW
jgi:WD40 repeat protein